MNEIQNIKKHWETLYGESANDELEAFVAELTNFRQAHEKDIADSQWFKDAVVYSLYVDLFNNTFDGLIEKLDYLEELGVTCLWLLPVLDSPMRDGGFDIRRYDRVRSDLLGIDESASHEEHEAKFANFLAEARKRKLKVIFDIAMNHSSDQNEWFLDAKSDKNSTYRDFYIWSDTTEKYKDARLLFKGMEPSNWEKSGDEYFFHRFYRFQPDLNYRNPKVLTSMCRYLLYWMSQGIDGFRADAIPFLWKEEGTDCENLDNTHVIIKIFRSMFDFARPGTFLLAEACQPPTEVVKYFGDADECHAAYHFPVMPQIFKSFVVQNGQPIIDVLKEEITPSIPDATQWFMFLRNHDELTLEMVSLEDRKILFEHYCRDERWTFREGEGVAGRMANLMDYNVDKIALAYSIMFTLPGTPIIYYGDEFGQENDDKYFEETAAMTGFKDARFFNRGPVDWPSVDEKLQTEGSFNKQVNRLIKTQLKTRNNTQCFGRGTNTWVSLNAPDGTLAKSIFAYYREFEGEKILVVNNLSETEQHFISPVPTDTNDMLGQIIGNKGNEVKIGAWGYHWIKIE